MFAGVGLVLVCITAAVVLGVRHDGAEIAQWVAGIGALGYFISTIVAIIPQKVTLEVRAKEIAPSWRRKIAVERVELATWVAAGVDAAVGLAVVVRGAGGSLAIGGDGHDGEGYQLTGKPTRSVDCNLSSAGELDALLRALGIERGEAGPLVVPLVRSTQSFVGLVRGMAPWLVTITLLGIFGIVLGNTVAGAELLASSNGQLAIAVISGGLAVVGLAAMIVRSRRVRVPELELREQGDSLVVVEMRRGTEHRVRWSELAIEKLHHTVSSRVGSFTLPLLVLGLPGRKPLRIGAWDAHLAWPGEPAKTWRGPAFIVGGPQWKKLVDVLKRRGRL